METDNLRLRQLQLIINSKVHTLFLEIPPKLCIAEHLRIFKMSEHEISSQAQASEWTPSSATSFTQDKFLRFSLSLSFFFKEFKFSPDGLSRCF